jgi:3-hydroxyisobutyrate dehydrogenase-like beta-hydroxyacid dehydrogenase
MKGNTMKDFFLDDLDRAALMNILKDVIATCWISHQFIDEHVADSVEMKKFMLQGLKDRGTALSTALDVDVEDVIAELMKEAGPSVN